MKNKLIVVTGGSGVGKSTLVECIFKKDSENIVVVNLDNYILLNPPILSKVDDIENWEEPTTIDFERLYRDVFLLKNNKSAMVPLMMKSNKVVEKKPKPLIILEGFLAMHSERIREMSDLSFFLDTTHKDRWKRKIHTKFKYKEYEEKIIIPMYKKYVEPAKKNTDYLINVLNKSREDLCDEVWLLIKKNNKLN